MATADKLRKLLETKNKLKQALINKGVDVADTDSFDSYVGKIDSITTSSTVSMPDYLSEVEYTHMKSGTNASGFPIPYVPNVKTKLEMEFAITGYSTTATNQNRQVFGSYTGTSGDNVFGLLVNKSGVLTSTWGTVLVNRKYCSMIAPKTNTIYTIVMDNNGTTLDGTVYPVQGLETTEALADDWVADNPFWIFPAGNVSVSYVAYIKIYSAKIYEDNALKHDIIPVKHKVSGNYGLYDKVTGGYFESTAYIQNYTGGSEVDNDEWGDEW